MKVILLKDVSKVGQRGSVVDVADGFALNSLIPRGMAEQATPAKLAAHAEAEEREKAAHDKEQQALIATVKSIENARIELTARATDKGGLFKAITADDIAKALLDQRGAKLPAEAIQLDKHIKQIGEHAITIHASGVEAHIALVVSPSER